MNSDPHALDVKRLADTGNWAGLVRYWMAHRHQPALDAAIACAHARAVSDPGWRTLPKFLEQVKAEPIDLQRQAPESLPTRCDEIEKATLGILVLDPRAAFCELAAQFAIERQDQLLRMGLEAAFQAATLAASCEDTGRSAHSTSLLWRVDSRSCGNWRKPSNSMAKH